MKKKSGFTLIELLAVIVILAIIALIAIPVIMNIISKTNKSAYKDSVYGIIKAGELYYSEKLLGIEGIKEDVSFIFPEADGLDLKGSKPTSGTMIVRKDGKVAIAVSNRKYCAKKGYNDTDLTIEDNTKDCFIPILVEELITNDTNIELLLDEIKKIEYEIIPVSSTNKKLKITSKDENIASILEDGKITGVGVGTTIITIETQDGSSIKKEITVTVNPVLATQIKLSTTTITIEKGTSEAVTAVLSPTNVTNKNINWKSNNLKVATVEDGVITGVSAGTTTITVTSGDSKVSENINVTVEEKLLESTNNCINSNSVCPSGTKVNVKVSDTESYDFYVIKDTGTRLTMIMDRNLGGKVAWYETTANNKGPLIALNALKERTSSWTNIEPYSYTLIDDEDPLGGTSRYQPISGIDAVTNVRARFLKYTEIASFGCKYQTQNTCPDYLFKNLSSSNTEAAPGGYWLSTSDSHSTAHAMSMSYHNYLSHDVVNTTIGIRPVIEMDKKL